MSINVVPFTAHADCAETSAFIAELHPQCVIFVHGNKKEMASLEKKLTLQYANDPSIEFFSPENSQMVTVQFSKKKLVRVVGKLATDILPVIEPKDAIKSNEVVASDGNNGADADTTNAAVSNGAILSGLIVCTNYNYLFMKTEDLQNFVSLASTQVLHKISIPFQQSFEIAKVLLSQVY
uniref:Cleavage and polyadenylation specificity factor subunit 3-I n=1 Tax=Lygus hesperus TaxID=30085 RepID=A0A0A9X3E9_LYGHE